MFQDAPSEQRETGQNSSSGPGCRPGVQGVQGGRRTPWRGGPDSECIKKALESEVVLRRFKDERRGNLLLVGKRLGEIPMWLAATISAVMFRWLAASFRPVGMYRIVCKASVAQLPPLLAIPPR